jgi:rare lipoprotein A
MRWVALVALLAVLPGCSFFGRGRAPSRAEGGGAQEGVASWYGPGFHGNRTSSGEIYNQYDLTAAHKTLPLGTRVAVTNLDNGRSVEVRVNDRGPFVGGRIIDLSYAAARNLGMIGSGTCPVRVEVLASDGAIAAVGFAVQVGSFSDATKAERLRAALHARFKNVYVSPLTSGASRYYRVRIGRFPSRDKARAEARRVVSLGLPAIIVED